jgi:flavin-dependent dehydrogenase
VVLLEARAYPHDKLCGEFLSPECAGLLDDLGVTPVLRALAPVSIDTVCLTAPGGAAWESRLPGTAWGLTRQALDQSLAQRARAVGVEVRTSVSVTGIDGRLAQGFTLRVVGARPSHGADAGDQAVRARTVIAAHGKRGALDRSLGRRFLHQPQPFLALKAHFAGPPLPGRIELHGFPGGYCGMSEIESSSEMQCTSEIGGSASTTCHAANVCLLVHDTIFRRAGAAGPERVTAFIRWMRAQNPRLDAWLARATPLDERWLSIAQVPFGPKRPVEAEVLMAGDAAGLIVPLAGDGIAMALRGGQLAAEHSARFLSGRCSAVSLMDGYARAWSREFNARLRLGRLLQIVMLRPRLLGLGLRLLSAAPALGRYVVARTRAAPAAGSPAPVAESS